MKMLLSALLLAVSVSAASVKPAGTTELDASTCAPFHRTFFEVYYDLYKINSTFLDEALEIAKNLDTTSKQKNEAYVKAFEHLPAGEKKLAVELGCYEVVKIVKAAIKLREQMNRMSDDDRSKLENYLKFVEDETITGRQVLERTHDAYASLSPNARGALDTFFSTLF